MSHPYTFALYRKAEDTLELIKPLFAIDDLLLKTWMLTLLPEDVPWLLDNVAEAIPFQTALTASRWKEKYIKPLKEYEVCKAQLQTDL